MGIDPARLGATKKSRNIFETKDDQQEIIRQKLESRLTILPDADPSSTSTATHTATSGPTNNPRVEWIVLEIKLPSYYHWPQKPTCSRFFLSVLKARNPNHDGNQAELNSIQAIAEILAKALTVRHLHPRPSPPLPPI
jgi:hypothetical protein